MNNEMLQISHRMPQEKAKKLRRQGYVPGVLYGYDQVTLPVIFEKKRVENFVHHVGDSALFEISLDGEIRPVRIREIQRDPVTHEIIHMDLQNVHMDRRIQVEVPLKFEGIHAMEKRGYILQHQKNTVEVEGLAKDIPAHIKVPVHNLDQKHSIRVVDLEVAEEISIIDAPEEVIAMMVKPTREELPEDTPKEAKPVESADDRDED